MKICIDPGHGGSDPGACNGQYQEATYALAMALKLGEVLEQRGYAVVYTRRTNATVTLGGRCVIANNAKADLFVSIHLNSAAQSAANGIETLCYSKGSNAGKLAEKVQVALIRATGATDRGVKERTNLYVLKNTKMPAILVETGFISNYTDLKRLITVGCQDTIVAAIADGIDAYLGKASAIKEPKKELTGVTDILADLEARGIVSDIQGMRNEISRDPNGRLYWLARKCVNYMHEKEI